MLEIAFSESAQGGLRMAQSCCAPTAFGVVLTHEDGSRPTRSELRAARRQVERDARRCWAEAVPLGSTAGGVYGFPLCLSMGNIAGEPLGPERKTVLECLYGAADPRGEEVAAELMAHAAEQFRSLLEQLRQGETARVWHSDQPDERCGLSWLCWELHRRGIQAPVHLVALPRYEERGDNTLVRYISWGEMEPERFGAFLSRQREAGPVLRSALAQEWEALRRENGPLRAVVNGRLRTVPADFYDFALRRALAEQPQEFHQAQVIGLTLGKYLPGISDCYLALRMEAMLESGELEALEDAPEGGPSYHRRLRKTPLFQPPKNF